MSACDTGVSRWKCSDLNEKVRGYWYARRVTVDRYRDRSIRVRQTDRALYFRAKSAGSLTPSRRKNSIWSRGDRRYSRSALPVDGYRESCAQVKVCRGFTFDLICLVYLASPMNGTVPPAVVNDRPETREGFWASGRRTKDDNVGDRAGDHADRSETECSQSTQDFFSSVPWSAEDGVRARISPF